MPKFPHPANQPASLLRNQTRSVVPLLPTAPPQPPPPTAPVLYRRTAPHAQEHIPSSNHPALRQAVLITYVFTFLVNRETPLSFLPSAWDPNLFTIVRASRRD